MLIGNAYITKHFFCFTGSLNQSGLSVILPLMDILEIKEALTASILERYKRLPRIEALSSADMAAGISGNAVLIVDRFQQVHRFFSVGNVKRFKSSLESIKQQLQQSMSSGVQYTNTPTMGLVQQGGAHASRMGPPPLPSRALSTKAAAPPTTATAKTTPIMDHSGPPPALPPRAGSIPINPQMTTTPTYVGLPPVLPPRHHNINNPTTNV